MSTNFLFAMISRGLVFILLFIIVAVTVRSQPSTKGASGFRALRIGIPTDSLLHAASSEGWEVLSRRDSMFYPDETLLIFAPKKGSDALRRIGAPRLTEKRNAYICTEFLSRFTKPPFVILQLTATLGTSAKSLMLKIGFLTVLTFYVIITV